jgi:signal transduction histidine kinase
VAAAVVLGAGMFALSRNVTQRDERRLATLQAQDAVTAVTATVRQLESTMSSVGSVAAATNGDPGALDRLATADPAVSIFSAVVILHKEAHGAISVTNQRGDPSFPVPSSTGFGSQALKAVIADGGTHLVGLWGHGAQRHLALAEGAPAVPGGFVVYVEIPLSEGVTAKSGFPGLQYALYAGRSQSAPLLVSTTKALPIGGQRVDELIDLATLSTTTSPKRGESDLLFVVGATGSPVGLLSDLLPWILAGVAILAGLLLAFVVETTARRKDEALALVTHLEEKNAELDRAMDEQAKAEEARVRLETELRQSQRLEAVGRLAGGVAHDFNNLLAAILTYSEFVSDELGADHPLQDDVAEIRKAGRRAAELTRQLLVFSRRDLVQASVLDVNDAISDLLNLLRRTLGEDIELRTVLAPDLTHVLADRGEIEQVLVNLVVNARDAIEGEGSITVETSEQMIDEDAASAHADLRPGRFVRIAVTDTGSGMTPDVARQVFEPFFTTKGPGAGTGLGLSTVYGIANRYGGYVTVYSELGTGTSFKVYLPATDDRAEARIVDTTAEPVRATGETVLLVEDEDAVRKACRRILERAGFRVIEASDGSTALAELSDEPFDLLVTDVIMPGGVSGRDLANRLQDARPGLPVLFMSGYSADEIATRGILEEGISVVEKPFTTSDLLGKVRELLPSAPAPSP